MIKVLEKNKIYSKFIKKATAKNKLLKVQIDVIHDCNAACIFCLQGNEPPANKNYLTLAEMKKLLRRLKRMGVFHVGFSGGEPFMRKDFVEILNYASRCGFMVSAVTNLHVANQNSLMEISQIPDLRLLVSFHSQNPDNYRKHFGLKSDIFFETLEKIKYLLGSNVSVGIAVTVTKYNISELGDIKDFFIKMGMQSKDINFNFLKSGKIDILNLRPSLNDVKNLLESRPDITNEFKKINNKSFLCSAGRISCTISPHGDVFPCGFMNDSAGNVKNCDIETIWNNSHFFKFIRSIKEENFTKCSLCEIRSKCDVCMGSNLQSTGNFSVALDEDCLLRKAFLN